MDTNSTLRLLSSRESEIASLIADGHTNAEIAERLGISFWTAKWHVSEILSKLGVDSREEAAALWKREHSLRGRMRRAPAGVLAAFTLKPIFPVLAGTVLTFAGVFVAFAYAGGAGQGPRSADDGSKSPTIASATPVTPQAPPFAYVVQPGDTCASIVAKFGLQEWALKARNQINDDCTNLGVGQLLRVGMPNPGTIDSANAVRLADLDGDPASGYLSGFVDQQQGLVLHQHDESGKDVQSNDVSNFREWEFFIAGGGTGDGIGGRLAVAGTERVSRIDLVVDGGPPVSFTPQDAPAALGYSLRVLYVTVPAGRVWEFLAYDDAGIYLGTVAHGGGLGAGETYVVKTAPGGPTPTPPGPRPDPLDLNSNGHVVAIWPAEGDSVAQWMTAGPVNPEKQTGVCALIKEDARGPAIRLEDVEFQIDNVDVTAHLTRFFDGEPETATTGVLCYAPESGLAPGAHYASIWLHTSADWENGMIEGRISWQFEVVADPATPTAN